MINKVVMKLSEAGGIEKITPRKNEQGGLEFIPNAEDLVIEFKNKGGDKFKLFFEQGNEEWIISKFDSGDWDQLLFFELLRDAEACAEILKRSV